MSAATELRAAALADRDLLQMLLQERSFRQWYSTHLWLAELADLMAPVLRRHPTARIGLRELARTMERHARCVEPTLVALGGERADEHLVAASGKFRDHAIGAGLEPAAGLPLAYPPLPPRLLAWQREPPQSLLGGEETPLGEQPTLSSAQLKPEALSELPMASCLELGSRDRSRFALVRATGALEEVLACFQMLSAELRLPFRRDAVERILWEGLNRGHQPNLQLCGSLGAMLGLHVSDVRVPASEGTRLETPSLVSWNGSFAIVQLSNAQGMVLTSPRDGWVELRPEQIQDQFREGIELLLPERSSGTPEQRFGFSWFWPVLRRYLFCLSRLVSSQEGVRPLRVEVRPTNPDLTPHA